MKISSLFIFLAVVTHHLTGQAPCENGFADGYPCNQIDLLAHMSPDELDATEYGGFYLNDIWGWTDTLTGKEYALVGLVDGVAFVDISIPTAPVLVGKLSEPESANSRKNRLSEVQHGKSTWRDIKTYQNHAFIVSDLNSAHGMQIFDLTKLRNLDGKRIAKLEHDYHYKEFGSAHNIVINESTGYAFVVGISSGVNHCSSGLHVINIQNPKEPQFVSCFGEDGYTHDAQCVTYQGNDPDYFNYSICFNANVDALTIVNVEDPNNPTMISSSGYENSRYTHQGWLTEDHQYYLMNDELDEGDFGHNAKTLIWDIKDLDAPLLIGSYVNNVSAIDHNLYVHNELIYEANYWSGLRVLTLDQIASGDLIEIASFDTYPEGDGIHFGGAWGNYPFFESGTIIVSDMNNGLFILSLDTLTNPINQMPIDQSSCVMSTGYQFKVDNSGDYEYQWQSFNGMEYLDIVDNAMYRGTNTNSLTVIPEISIDNLMFRCKLTDSALNTFYTYLVKYTGTIYGPSADFEVISDDNGVASFTNQSQNATSYLWDFGDGTSSIEEHPHHQFDLGIYEVTLTAFNDCGQASVTQTTHLITGINEESRDLRLYPNPAINYINVYSKEPGLLSIYNLSGELVISFSKHSGIEYFNINDLSSGSYIVKLSTDLGTISKVLMKK